MRFVQKKNIQGKFRFIATSNLNVLVVPHDDMCTIALPYILTWEQLPCNHFQRCSSKCNIVNGHGNSRLVINFLLIHCLTLKGILRKMNFCAIGMKNDISFLVNVNHIIYKGERRQLCFVTLNGNLAVSGWVGLAYDR